MVIGLGLKFKSWPSRIPYQKHYHSLLSADRNLLSLLKSCKKASETSQIHGLLVKSGLDLVPFTLSKLLASSVLVSIDHAASIFKHIQNPSLFMFNTMLRGYSICDDPEKAFLLYNYMRSQNILLDQFSFVSPLKSCSRLCATWKGQEIHPRLCATCKGQEIHSVVVRSGHDLFVNVKNALVRFYSACGEIGGARQMFDEFPQRDLVSWNTLMSGYLHASQPSVVIDLFRQLHRDAVRFGVCTILSALSAVGHVGDILGGESFHGYCIKTGFCLDLNVATAMIAMYGKIGLIDSGRRIFNEVPVKDIVLWNCLIDGYAKSGLLEESLALLQTLKLEQLKPNSSTLAGLLSACAASGALAVGQSIHNYVDVEQPALDAVLGTALVDMYCKSGMLDKAIEVFDRIEGKDVKSWTAMISGFGMHGQAKNAIAFFQRMKVEGYRPNEVTFLAVLSACSHVGLVKEGMSCFESMVQDYGLTPKAEHYGCIVDLLGRAGLLEEAYKLIECLTFEADATAWRTLLAACRVHGDVSLGKHVKKLLEKIFEEHPADSMVLLSTYAIAGRLPDNASMQGIKEGRIGKSSESMPIELKKAGRSSIEVGNQRL